MGGGIGQVFQSMGNLLQTVAPIADLVFPGLGRAIAAAGSLMNNIAGYASKMDEEGAARIAEDVRQTKTAMAAVSDKARAAAAAATGKAEAGALGMITEQLDKFQQVAEQVQVDLQAAAKNVTA